MKLNKRNIAINYSAWDDIDEAINYLVNCAKKHTRNYYSKSKIVKDLIISYYEFKSMNEK